MKKTKLANFFFYLSLFFMGCKTPPIEKNNNLLKGNLTELPELQIYFPSFMTNDGKGKKEKMIGGDCSIIILPNGETLLIDCLDTKAQDSLVDYLHSLGITKIDYFIATHNHRDHIGCLPALIENFQIDNYYWNGVHFNTDIDEAVTKALEEKNIKTSVLEKGDFIKLSDNPTCTIEVLWPVLSEIDLDKAFYNPEKNQRLRNNTSLVFKLTYGSFTVLFTGDTNIKSERILTKTYGEKLKSTILKVPHHGDIYTANTNSFIKKVSPQVAVILDNQYMNFIISSKYRRNKAKLLYRNSAGYIKINSDGNNYSIEEKTFD